jgi:hypothetical protein
VNEVASVGGLRETEGSVFIDFIGAPTGFEPVSQPVIGTYTVYTCISAVDP